MEPVAGGLEGETASTSCLWLVPVSFMSVDPLPLSRFLDNSLFLPFCSMGVSYQCSVWHLCRTVVPAGKITPVTSGSWLCDLKRQPGFREVSPLSAQSRDATSGLNVGAMENLLFEILKTRNLSRLSTGGHRVSQIGFDQTKTVN